MTTALEIILSINLGFFFGLGFFWLLRKNSELYLFGERIWLSMLIHIARFGSLAIVFFIISKFGALPLLASFGGFLLSRIVFLKYIFSENA